MNKPQKPRNDNIAGFFGKLFRMKKQKPSGRPGQTSGLQSRASTVIPIKETTGVDAFSRFRNLSSNAEPFSPPATKPDSPFPYQNRPIEPPEWEQRDFKEPASPTSTSASPAPTKPRFFELSKALPAFWTIASLLSFTVNVILIVAIILLGRELFVLKAMVGNDLLGGLYENFIYMDQAHIKTDISVSDTIPINFTLPISQDTVVVLTQNTAINGAHVTINTGGISINSSANIVLPAGTSLPVHLELQVPVSASVPVQLNVPVDIPLQQTDLHKPFIGLQQVVSPFYYMLQPQVQSAQDLPFCGQNPGMCTFFFQK